MRIPTIADASPLPKALPGERLELVTRTAVRRRIRLVDQSVESVDESDTATTMVRSSSDGGVGYATISRTGAADVTDAVAIARRLRLPARLLSPVPEPSAVDDSDETLAAWTHLRSTSVDASADRLRTLAAIPADRRIARRQATWDHVAQQVTVADSDGRLISYRHPEVTLALAVTAADGSCRSTGTAGRTAADVDHVEDLAIVDEAVEEALRRLPAARPDPAGGVDCVRLVIAPRAAARLVAQIGAVFYGDRPDLERTGLRVPGAEVLARGLSLVDDGRSSTGLCPVPCDDEGTVAQRTVLVGDGRCRSLLHDRSSPLDAEASTGNGWMVPSGSGVGLAIAVSGSVLTLIGPISAVEDLVAGPDPTLYVTRIDDGSGRALDAAHNSIRMAVSGWLIRHGDVVTPVSGAAVGMKLDDFLGRVDSVSDVRQDYRIGAGSTLRKGVAVHSSHISVRDIPVGLGERSESRS